MGEERNWYYRKYAYDLKLYKGIRSVALTRQFSEFIIYSQIAFNFRLSISHLMSPEELFFATLTRVKIIQQKGNHLFYFKRILFSP